jgi:hypothetical protein
VGFSAVLEAAPYYKTQFPAGHEKGPQAGGGKSSGRYRAAAKTAAVARYSKRAAARHAAVTQTGRLMNMKKRALQDAGGG